MRIVSLLPSATEMTAALGLGEELVAVSHECDHPPELVDDLPRITSGLDLAGHTPDAIDRAVVDAVERGEALYQIDGDLLTGLQPDLILTQGICDVCAVSDRDVDAALLTLAQVMPEVETVTFTGGTWEGILHDVTMLGKAAGRVEAASVVVDVLRARWSAIEPVSANRDVLVLEWADPLFSAGHWVPEQVAAAGGVEILGDAGERSRRVDPEEAAALRPEVVAMAACGYDVTGNRELAEDLLWRWGDAELWAVDANSYFSRPGPRVVDGAELMRSILGGDPVSESAAVRVR